MDFAEQLDFKNTFDLIFFNIGILNIILIMGVIFYNDLRYPNILLFDFSIRFLNLSIKILFKILFDFNIFEI